MSRRNSNVEHLMMACLSFSIIGALIAGVVGGLVGCILAIVLSISVWHNHSWQNQTLYDANGKPAAMLKFCECGESEFGGWFERDKTE